MALGRSFRGGAVLGILALGICVSAPAGGALAAAPAPAPPHAPGHPGPSAAGSSATDSTVFAGYEALSAASSVTDRFVVPPISCTSGTTGGIGPGAYMVASGSEFDGADVSLQCSGGTLLSGEYVIVNNSNTEYGNPVAPGDVIEATVSLSETATTVTIKDLTKAHQFSLQGTGTGATAEAEFLGVDTLSGSSGVLPVPPLTSVPFSHASIGTTPVGSVSTTRLTLTRGCGVTLLATSVDSGATAFKVKPPSVSVTGLDPTSGPVGTAVTITGTGFTPSSKVKFNEAVAKTVVHTSATQVQATVPGKATSGPVTVYNPTPSGSGKSVCDFTVTPT